MLLYYQSAWFSLFFGVYLFESEEKNIGWSCYYNVFDLILISQNNDNGHPSFHYHSLQLNSSTRRYHRNNHSIRFDTIQVSFICFRSIRSIRYITIPFNTIETKLYSFYYTHHGLFFNISSSFHSCSNTVILGRFIRFDSIQYSKFYLFSFHSFRSIDTIRYDLFIYLD
ncbi:MAG: hypothetical protein ACI90V_009744 [Bacillariaceae sp.]|jgi:hypothetical protein